MTDIAADQTARLATALGARSDGSTSVDTTRGLLMTVLGEFVLPNGGRAWTRSLLGVLAAMGVRDKTARQALARAEGRWLERERVGRETRWTLTDPAERLLRDGATRIYGFGRDNRAWDGRWVVVLASVPESDRARRYRMGQGLSWIGFGSLGNGTWLSPWTEREPDAVALLDDLAISATSFLADLGGIGSGPGLVADAWDLPGLRHHYDQFLQDLAGVVADEPEGAVGELAAMVHRWRRFRFLDPDLPVELLDADWPGHLAAERFAAERMRLMPLTNAWWQASEGLD